MGKETRAGIEKKRESRMIKNREKSRERNALVSRAGSDLSKAQGKR